MHMKIIIIALIIILKFSEIKFYSANITTIALSRIFIIQEYMNPTIDVSPSENIKLRNIKQLSISQMEDPLSNPNYILAKTKKNEQKGEVDNKQEEYKNQKLRVLGNKEVNGGGNGSGIDDEGNVKGEWIVALAVVSFHIDEGQIIEHIMPDNALSNGDKKLLSLLSFPDSNSFSTEGCMKYIFRLKRDSKDIEYDYGFTYFKQKKDPNNTRGYFQKSLVILTSLPFIQFFKNITEKIGSTYFDPEGKNSNNVFLQSVYQCIKQWPLPIGGYSYELKILNETVTITLPRERSNKKRINGKFGIEIKAPVLHRASSINYDHDKQQQQQTHQNIIKSDIDTTPDKGKPEPKLEHILSDLGIQERGLFQDTNLFGIFKFDKIHLLWKLWELVLTNQPLLIISDSPAECSETVFGMISLISPLEYEGDYKPYFTIYDPAYKMYQEQYERKVVKNAILGVTNPLFLKSFKNFPNVLHLEKDYEIANSKQKVINYLISMTNKKFYTIPDKMVLQTLLKNTNEETNAINNSILRKHFRALTESFLKVFDEYFILQGNDIKKFDEKGFISFLENKKFSFQHYFISHAKIVKMYSKFIQSGNFISFMKNFENVYFVKNIYR